MWNAATYLRSEASNMVSLTLESVFGDKTREVGVGDAQSLDLGVEEGLDELPHTVGPGPQDVATRDVVELDESRSQEHLTVPLGKVLCLGGRDAQQRLALLVPTAATSTATSLLGLRLLLLGRLLLLLLLGCGGLLLLLEWLGLPVGLQRQDLLLLRTRSDRISNWSDLNPFE